MKKVKKIAKRLRARASVLRQNAALQSGDYAQLTLTADVLEEVALQLSPRPKKMLKALVKARKAAKKAAKAAATSATNNGATHATTARAGVGVGG